MNVIPDPAVILSPSSQTVCAGSNAAPIVATASGGLGAYTYQWYSNNANNATSGTMIPSATGDSYTPPTITTGTKYYYVVVSQTSTPGCSVVSTTVTIEVIAAPTISNQPIASTVCIGGNPTLLSVAYINGVGTPTYQWFSNSTNSVTGGTAIPGATSNSYQPSSASVGTTYYYVIITLPSGGCSSLTSAIVPVTIVAPVSITTQPMTDQSLCVGVTLPTALTVLHGGGTGTPTYQWYSNTTASNTGGTVVSGAILPTYTPPVFNTAGTYYYYATITMSGNGCGQTISNVATVNVIPDPTVILSPSSQTLCAGSNAAAIVAAASGGLGAYTYQWYSNNTNNTTSGTIIPSATGATYTPLTNTTGIKYYYVVVQQTATPGCSVVSSTTSVEVIAAPTISNQPIASTVCIGGTPTLLSVAYINGVGTPTYQWFSNTTNSVTGSIAISGATSSTYQPSSALAGTTYYYVIITLPSGGCSSLPSVIVPVTIVAPIAITTQPLADQSLCVGVTVPTALTISHDGGTGTATYQWYSNTTAANAGGTAISSATSITYQPPVFNIAGTYYYYATIMMSGSGCGQVATNVATVNVLPDPTVLLSPSSQTLCAGSNAAPIVATASGGLGTYTYQWFSNVNNNTTSGTSIPSATGATYTPPTIITGIQYYYVVIQQTSTPGCSVVSSTATVEVIAAPTISNQPADSTVCIGGNPTTLSVAYINGVGTPTYQWYSNTTDSTTGGVAISGATSNTYQPSSASADTIYYYVEITLPSGGCSSLTSTVASVTILDLPVIEVQPVATQSICVGGSIASPLSLVYSGGTGTATYQWYFNNSNATSGGTLIAGATSASYTPAAFTSTGTFYFYGTVTLNGSGCGTTATQSAEIVVVADPAISTQPLTSQTVCAAAVAVPLHVAASGGVGPLTYQWYSNVANSNTGGNLIAGANSDSYAPPTDLVGVAYYYVVVGTSASGCSVTSTTSAVTVTASPSFTAQPQPAIVCQGGTLLPLTVTYINGTGTPEYQWYASNSDDTTAGTAISGATSVSFTPLSNTIGIQYYYVIITLPPTAGCSSLTSDTAEVEITSGTTMITQPLATQSLCVGGISDALTVAYSGGTGTPAYQWYSNTTATNSGGTIITGATTASFTPPAFATAGTFYYYAVVSLNGNGCGPAASIVAEVIVVPDPTVTTQPLTSQTLCQGATPEPLLVVPSGGVGIFSYQWYSSTINANTGGTLISGATSDTFIPETSIIGTAYYYVIITQSGSGCSVTSAVAQVTVNLAPSIDQQPVGETVCVGGSIAQLSVSYINGTGTPTYQWFSNDIDSNVNGVLLPGANNATYTPPSTTVGTVYYYVAITLPAGGGCSAIVSEPAAITINALPTITLQPQAVQAICIDGNIPTALAVGYAGGTGTATYQWYTNTSNSNVGGSLIPGATLSTYMPPVFAAAGNYYYYAVVSLSGSGCGNATSDIATVTVVTDPIIDVQPLASQEVCQNAPATTLIVGVSGGTIAGYNYQWYINTSASTSGAEAIVGANAASFTPSTQLVGTYYYFVEVTQAPSAGCFVISSIAAVTANVAPAISSHPSSNIVCLGQPVDLLVGYDHGAGTPQYQWYSNTVESTVDGVPIPGATTNMYSPATNVAGITYYYAIISFVSGGCGNLVSNIGTITVNPNPEIASSALVICSGNAFTVTPDESTGDVVPMGTTYTWSAPTINPPGSITGASAESVPQSQISQLLVNTTTSPATVIYTVSPIAGFCPGADFTITVTVNPSISPNVTVTNSNCYNASTGSIQTNITGGIPFPGTPYQISWSGPNGFTSTDASIADLGPGIYTLTINDAGGCPFTANYTITEPAEILIAIDSEQDITCFGDADGAVMISLTGGTLPYQFTWTKNGTAYANTEDIANLDPGVYNVSVTDANNCGPATATFTIVEPPLLTLSLNSQTNILCFGDATGAIAVNVAGGTQIEVSSGVFGYIFAWTGPGNFTSGSQNLTNLVAGSYSLVVTDQHGCIENLTVNITQSTEIIITAATTPITCYGANNASIALTVTGGVGPYQANWSNLATGLFQDNLAAGTYVITITDGLNCPKPITVIIPEAPVFMVNPIVQQISCFGANNGSINLNLTGGIAPVTMVWNDGSTAGLIRNNLVPGTYTATISDGTPCHITRTFVIVEPQPLVLSGTVVNALICNNASSGSIDLTVAGGTAPYSYSWSNGAGSEDLAGITSGNYNVTVTDANGCVQSAQFSIIRPAPLGIQLETETQADCESGFVEKIYTAQASGGVAPYQYAWSSGAISGTNGEVMTTSQNTTVILEVTDSLGCTASLTFNAEVPQIDFDIFATTSTGFETYGVYSIVDPIHFTNGAQGAFQTISWNFGDGSFSTEENPTHAYVVEGDYVVTQTVTYPHGCVYTHVITLIVKKGYFLVVPDAFTPNSDSLNDTFRPVAKGLKNVYLTVYDTWGSLIYSEQGTVLRGWDGKIKGMTAENGNYFCKVSAETFYGEIINVNQPFVLIN